jgi:hypothetical protein
MMLSQPKDSAELCDDWGRNKIRRVCGISFNIDVSSSGEIEEIYEKRRIIGPGQDLQPIFPECDCMNYNTVFCIRDFESRDIILKMF